MSATTLKDIQSRKKALLTKRERDQIQRVILLLDRIYERRCVALDLEPGHGDEDEDEIAWPAHAASAKLDDLLEGDLDERAGLARAIEGLRVKAWLDGGGAMEDLEAAVRRRSSC